MFSIFVSTANYNKCTISEIVTKNLVTYQKIRRTAMLKHYVEYRCIGNLVSETQDYVYEIAERDVSKVNIEDDCFGFRFFDRTEMVVDGEILTGDRKNISGWYYIGEKITLEQIKATYGNTECIQNISNYMKYHNLTTCVKTKVKGYIYALNDEDQVI